jgi:AcrR family transcriptional regulator
MKKPRGVAGAPQLPRNARMERILDCAERAFATGGYNATPLQQIAHAAKVNQALVSYYFGSKEKLYQAIFLRRGLELSQERLRLLDALETNGRAPTVEQLIECFLVPAIKMGYEGSARRDFLRLQARLQNEPKEITSKLRAIVYDDVTRRFVAAFQRALPKIDAETIVWRVVMMIGAYLYLVSDSSRLEQLSGGRCKVNNAGELIEQLSAFMAGGFRQPLAKPARAKAKKRR